MGTHEPFVLPRATARSCSVAIPNEFLVLDFRRDRDGNPVWYFCERETSDAAYQPTRAALARATELAREAMDVRARSAA